MFVHFAVQNINLVHEVAKPLVVLLVDALHAIQIFELTLGVRREFRRPLQEFLGSGDVVLALFDSFVQSISNLSVVIA